jgi:hypothetical protein
VACPGRPHQAKKSSSARAYITRVKGLGTASSTSLRSGAESIRTAQDGRNRLTHFILRRSWLYASWEPTQAQ